MPRFVLIIEVLQHNRHINNIIIIYQYRACIHMSLKETYGENT
jgi:hypothetical protein